MKVFDSQSFTYVNIVYMQKMINSIKSKFEMNEGYDRLIHFSLLAIAAFGIVMITSASMGDSVYSIKVIILAIAKQAVFVGVGWYFMSMAARKFKLVQLHKRGFSLIILFMYALLLLCLVFTATNGAKAWIHIPLGITEITIQPSEFAKILTYLTVAAHLGDRKGSKEKMQKNLAKAALTCGIFAIIICFPQSDFGSAFVLFTIFCVCYLIPRNKYMSKSQKILKFLFLIACIFAFVLLFTDLGTDLINSLPLKQYQKNRIFTAIDPFQDRYGDGYQLIQSLIAMSSGGWIGTGIGRSVRKYMNFPEATTDYILGIVVEETGFVGFLLLLFAYGLIIYRLLWIANQMKSESGKIVLTGTAMYFLIHIFLNVGGVSGLLPLTGIPLPLMSAGGSSAVSFMLSIGLSQAIIGAYNRGEIR